MSRDFWEGYVPEPVKPAPVQEPVAWMRNDGKRVTTAAYRHNYPDYETRYSIPLYTTPPAAQRQPLTDEQIDAVCAPLGFAQLSPREVARAIEAAHGIKGAS